MVRKPLYTFENVEVYGNNHNVPLVYWWELTGKEKKEFDYIDDPEDNFTGFRYKGNVYDMGDIMRVESHGPNWMKNFHGYTNDTFFSGILIKYNDEDNDYIKVYTFYSK